MKGPPSDPTSAPPGTLTLVSCEKGNGQLAVLEGLHRAAHPPPPASIWDPERSRYSWQ